MKFALNGALTIGTLDGANIEILEHVGAENMFIFGLTAEQVTARRGLGVDSTDVIAASPILSEVLSSVADGVFSPDERDRYRGLVDSLRYHDYFLVCADFDDYYATQRRIADLWRRPEDWWQASILNTANVGWFSSDRSIREYADKVWNVPTYIAP
jgi:starch phosphorylase